MMMMTKMCDNYFDDYDDDHHHHHDSDVNNDNSIKGNRIIILQETCVIKKIYIRGNPTAAHAESLILPQV